MSIMFVFTNFELLKYICSFNREEYAKKMCKNIYVNWTKINDPNVCNMGINNRELKMWMKWEMYKSTIIKDDSYPSLIIGKIKNRKMITKYTNGIIHSNGIIWCFNTQSCRLLNLKHREDNKISWRNINV